MEFNSVYMAKMKLLLYVLPTENLPCPLDHNPSAHQHPYSAPLRYHDLLRYRHPLRYSDPLRYNPHRFYLLASGTTSSAMTMLALIRIWYAMEEFTVERVRTNMGVLLLNQHLLEHTVRVLTTSSVRTGRVSTTATCAMVAETAGVATTSRGAEW
jgi:hypothetical protein